MEAVGVESVGRLLLETAEYGNRSHTGLDELIESARRQPVKGDAASREQCRTLGAAALTAHQVTSDPAVLKAAADETRQRMLADVATYLRFVEDAQAWHLAPLPTTSYAHILDSVGDVSLTVVVGLSAASITRELAELDESLELLHKLDGVLARIPAWQVALVHAALGNTYRDLADFAAADHHYRAARDAVRRSTDEETSTEYRLRLEMEVFHQQQRLAMYSRDGSHRPTELPAGLDEALALAEAQDLPAAGTGPLPRDVTSQLLTMAQQAMDMNDLPGAYRCLRQLSEVVDPTDYALVAAMQQEVAGLAQAAGTDEDVIRWHTYLAICADLLNSSRRELGARLSGHAKRLAACSDHLAALNLARWAHAADCVRLHSGGIQGDIAYVLYRNGSLHLARSRYDESLRLDPGSVLVRAQRDLVGTLLPGDPDEPAPHMSAPSASPTLRSVISADRWRAAATLLSSPADEVGAWPDLLLYSKGRLSVSAPVLDVLVGSYTAIVGKVTDAELYAHLVDGVKGQLFGQLADSGLIGLLDRMFNLPDWAASAWVLSARDVTWAQDAAAVAVIVGGYQRRSQLLVTAAPAGAPAVSAELRRQLTAAVDQLLALTFMSGADHEAFGGAEAARRLRRGVSALLAEHGRNLTFGIRDEIHRPHQNEIERRQQEFTEAAARLPIRLQMAMTRITEARDRAAANGAITDVRRFVDEQLAALPPADANRLRDVYALYPRTTDILTTRHVHQRQEIGTWFRRPGQCTLDLLQGPDTLYAITAVSAGQPRIDVAPINVTRAQAESAAERHTLAAGRSAPASDRLAEADALFRRVVDHTRPLLGDADEVAVQWRAPWDAVPLENIPASTGRRLSDEYVTVRRHHRRPLSGVAGLRLGGRLEALGDPMGNTAHQRLPGAAEEVRQVAAHLGGAAHTQDDCTWPRLQVSARIADLLWISTHCEAVSGLGGMPALRLRDRWILPSEIATITVNPGQVVVLTVCAGGRGMRLSNVSEPPLAAAFLAAGASLVISPIRPIRDAVWSPLIVNALQLTVAGAGTYVELVRALNAATPDDEPVGPWIIHG